MISGEDIIIATHPADGMNALIEPTMESPRRIKLLSKDDIIKTLNELKNLEDFDSLYLPEFYCKSESLDWFHMHESKPLRDILLQKPERKHPSSEFTRKQLRKRIAEKRDTK